MSSTVYEVYERLRQAYGAAVRPQAEPPWEATVGAVLGQNAAPRNAERAIANLDQAGVMTVEALHAMDDDELAELIRPAGHVGLKVRRLKNLARLVVERYDGSLEALFAGDRETLREQLLSLNGIGPETADAIILEAADKPAFVVEGHAARVFKRHGWIEFEADYYAIQEHFESALESSAVLFKEYRALLASVGADYCRKEPHCERCPLREMLPEGGPREPERF
jgi:endonuclease-3 related protein